MAPSHPTKPEDSVAFLVSRLGFDAGRRYATLLAPLDLEPRHVGLLRFVSNAEGRSQQALGEALGVSPSRMVTLVDDLEERGLLERRNNPLDRRARALYLTDHGHEVLDEALRVAATHEDDVCAPLDAAEREQLLSLLQKLVAARGTLDGVHPGLKA